MKVTIETIGGELYTVVWHIEVPTNLLGRRSAKLAGGALAFFRDAECLAHIATALPALPLRPKPCDALLLYRYASEGIHVFGDAFNIFSGGEEELAESQVEIEPRRDGLFLDNAYGQNIYCPSWMYISITHAVNAQGERIEIAITDREAK